MRSRSVSGPAAKTDVPASLAPSLPTACEPVTPTEPIQRSLGFLEMMFTTPPRASEP